MYEYLYKNNQYFPYKIFNWHTGKDTVQDKEKKIPIFSHSIIL